MWTWHGNASEGTRARIAAHYDFAIRATFAPPNAHEYIILLEDDLYCSPDFVDYMFSFLPLLDTGPESCDRLKDDVGTFDTLQGSTTTVCVSAWNDNSASPFFQDLGAVSRTTFFPGLGWGMSVGFWKSCLEPIWPITDSNETRNGSAIVGIGWDYWLRSMFDSMHWDCVIPHVSRVRHARSGGTHIGRDQQSRLDAMKFANDTSGRAIWGRFALRSYDAATELLRRTEDIVCSLWPRASEISPAGVLEAVERCREDHNLPKRSAVITMHYGREHYQEHVAKPLGLWHTPRGHYGFALNVPVTANSWLRLIDARRNLYVPTSPRTCPRTGMILVRAEMGSSCDGTCSRVFPGTYTCTEASLEFANSCNTLRTYFPCRTCAFESGTDLPAYIPRAQGGNLATEGICLVAETGAAKDGYLSCTGWYQWSCRLCGCMPKSSSTVSPGGPAFP